MLNPKESLILLSLVVIAQGYEVDKRLLFGEKKKTTTPTPTTQAITSKPALVSLRDMVNTVTEAGNVLVKEGTAILAKPLGKLSENLETVKNVGNELAPVDASAIVAPLEVHKALVSDAEELKLVVTTEEPITSAEAHGFNSFLSKSSKNVPILNVVLDALFKIVDNLVDLSGNLIESVKTGNPLEILKSAVKFLPRVDEDLVDKVFDTVEDKLINLPNTLDGGAKQGADLINATAGVTGKVISGVFNPLTNVVSTAIEKGNSLLNVTGDLIGKTIEPIARLRIDSVNNSLSGARHLIAEGTNGITDGNLLVFVVGGILLICLISICIFCIWKYVKNKKQTANVPYTPGKKGNGEETENLLP